MCGICGVVGLSADAAAGPLAGMLSGLRHRGPDDEGVFREGGVGLGIRRLSIIAPRDGKQPLRSEDGSVVLVANGEIYNFVELRQALVSRGHRFATGSDCEVIVHLYEEHGAACVRHLRGMFAFALLDRRRSVLLLARDRLGEKPLYVYRRGSRLCFASELGSLLSSGLVPFAVDHRALRDYLHYQYVPDPHTLVEKVQQLSAGHLLIVDLKDGSGSEHCYWSLEASEGVEEEPGAAIRAELDQVGRIIVRADVPLAVALSGGLDSATVGALVAANARGSTALSVGYEGRPAVDERRMAARVARALGLEHHEAELTGNGVVSAFDCVVASMDQPVADMACFGYHVLARAARERGLKVLFYGHGGDELFWGYRWARAALHQFDGRDAAAVGRCEFYACSEAVASARRILPRVCTPAFAAVGSLADETEEPEPVELPVRLTRLLVDTYLRTNGIVQTERLSMAAGVEVRLPLLDWRLVEVVAGLRKVRRDDELPPKAWLREAVVGLVPDFMVQRPKRPFFTPTRFWHRLLFEAYGQRVTDGWLASSGVFTRTGAERVSRGHCGLGSGTSLSLKALVLETWIDRARGIAANARPL